MLQRIDDLDRENEQLREEVAELQDLKEELEERIDRTGDRSRDTENELKEQKVSYMLLEISVTLMQQILTRLSCPSLEII